MQHYTSLLIGLEMQIESFLFHCSSCLPESDGMWYLSRRKWQVNAACCGATKLYRPRVGFGAYNGCSAFMVKRWCSCEWCTCRLVQWWRMARTADNQWQRSPELVVQPWTYVPADCWFTNAWIICYILNQSFILSLQSLQYSALVQCLCIYAPLLQ